MRKLLGLVAQQTPEVGTSPAIEPGSVFETLPASPCPCCGRPCRCVVSSPSDGPLVPGAVIICANCWCLMVLCKKGHMHACDTLALSICNETNPVRFAQAIAGQRAWRARELARRKPANFYFGQN